MRKLTGVVAAVAVAVTLALPTFAAAQNISHRDGPHGCSKNAANPSHGNGPGCGKRRGNTDRLNHGHQGPGIKGGGGNNNEDRAQRNSRNGRGGD